MASSTSTEEVVQLRWRDTLARSGKLKDKTYVTPTPPSVGTRTKRKFNVRFREDVVRARKSRRLGRDSTARSGVLAASPASLVTTSPSDDYLQPREPPVDVDVIASTNSNFEQDAFENAWATASVPDTAVAHFDEALGLMDQQGNQLTIDDTAIAVDDPFDGVGRVSPLHILEVEDDCLTIQDDILPNIPRELSPLSAGHEVPSSDRRFFIQHYIEKVIARLMPLWNAPDNPFISIVIPAAMDSPVLQHAVMALSAYHYSLEPVDGDDMSTNDRRRNASEIKALWHKQRVLALLQENLTKPEALRDDSTMAACMLMQTFEVLRSGTSEWDHWLRGASLFVQMRGRLEHDLKDSNDWMRLVKCIVAVETFAATSAGFDLSVSGEYWNIYRRLRKDDLRKIASGERSQLEGEPDDSHFEKLVGCPAVVVYALSRMVMLVQSRYEVEQTHEEDPEWHDAWAVEALKLENLLLRWRPKQLDRDKAHLTEAFRHAALVFYSRKIRRLAYPHATVQYHVQATFDHLLALSHSHQLEGIALWPTMIAALQIDEREQHTLMDMAVDRIRVMRRQKGDPLYDNAESMLKLVWSRRREAKSWEERVAIEWEDVSKEMGWSWCMV